jgi:hypothetical protein
MFEMGNLLSGAGAADSIRRRSVIELAASPGLGLRGLASGGMPALRKWGLLKFGVRMA